MKAEPEALAKGVLAGSRAALGQAITLLESERRAPDAARLLELLGSAPKGRPTVRVGLTGVPGVGKSTLIEALGLELLGRGHRVAVLAIDPSSPRHGGSILGDKTRMPRLARETGAFIRPTPSGGTLGGVHRKTRHAIRAVEAAGFDVILVETVGVGQSEVSVADMVDVFVVLLLPNAGDDLQGIKKGLIEVADLLAVGKADLDAAAARRSARDYVAALRLLHREDTEVPVYSGATGEGVAALWSTVMGRVDDARASGAFDARRRSQEVAWFRALVRDGALERFYGERGRAELIKAAAATVGAGVETPLTAALRVLTI